MERRREEAYGDLKGLLATVQGTQENLQRETSSLVTALRRTSARAGWGEVTLRRVVELAGMVESCDFEEQPAVGARNTGASASQLALGIRWNNYFSLTPLQSARDLPTTERQDHPPVCRARRASSMNPWSLDHGEFLGFLTEFAVRQGLQ